MLVFPANRHQARVGGSHQLPAAACRTGTRVTYQFNNIQYRTMTDTKKRQSLKCESHNNKDSSFTLTSINEYK